MLFKALIIQSLYNLSDDQLEYQIIDRVSFKRFLGLKKSDKVPRQRNTLIILFSDHGFHLGEKEHWGKHTPWQRATRVPFVIVPPKNNQPVNFKPGMTRDEPVNLLDIYPTLVDMCGLPAKVGLDGNAGKGGNFSN